jgi:hypothetical protein
MKSKYVSKLDDFYWQKNLRYYWNTDALEGLGHLTVAMVSILYRKLIETFRDPYGVNDFLD